MKYPTIEDFVGKTPLVRLQRLPGKTSNTILVKLEGNNPAGSVKDRPALSMISHAEARGDIRPGDTLIGIAKQFAIDVDDLARDNELDPADKLRKGALLWLMVKKTVLHRWRDSGQARSLREARLKRNAAKEKSSGARSKKAASTKKSNKKG